MTVRALLLLVLIAFGARAAAYAPSSAASIGPSISAMAPGADHVEVAKIAKSKRRTDAQVSLEISSAVPLPPAADAIDADVWIPASYSEPNQPRPPCLG